MRLAASVMAACLAGAGASVSAQAQTFDLTFGSFRQALDRAIRADNGDPIASCRTIRIAQAYTFSDVGFQKTVAEMKRLDMLNGRFDRRTRLEADLRGGKVSEIRITGDRSDPVNLMAFITLTMNVMQAFDPSLPAEDTRSVAETLGLMRGDAAPDIGRPRLDIRPYATITCAQYPTQFSSRMECVFGPRF